MIIFKKSILSLCLLAAMSGMCGVLCAVENQVLVDKGKARAVIVIPKQPAPSVRYAAEELRDTIRAITGAEMKIMQDAPTGVSKIFLGTPNASFIERNIKIFSKDLKKLEGNDGFAIRSIEENIYIFGSEPKGVLNGVYRFLEENTDIIWARPASYGTIFSKCDTFVATHNSFSEIPKFSLRGWHIVGIWRHDHEPTERWMARNLSNYIPIAPNRYDLFLKRRLKRGFPVESSGGHNLLQYITKQKYFKSHPEFFGLVNGERRADIRVQPCFRNKEMVKAFIKEVKSELSSFSKKYEKYNISIKNLKNFGISIQDTWSVCRCPLCESPLMLPDGSLITPDDKAYDSTCFFMFLNEVAKAVYQEYPDIRIPTFAYFFTVVPPKVKVFKNIDIVFCPLPRDYKHDINAPVNSKWLDNLEAWRKRTSNIVWREYYGDWCFFPRPLVTIVSRELRQINEMDVVKVYSEILPDDIKHPPKRFAPFRLASLWNASAMQLYMISHLEWDPYQDVDKLRERFLTRAYREGADNMREFFKLIRGSYYASPRFVRFDDDAAGAFEHYIREPGIEKRCRGELLAALKKALHSGSRKMIEAQLSNFDLMAATLAKRPAEKLHIPYSRETLTGNLDFKSSPWRGATAINGFKIMGSDKPSLHKTIVRLAHDTQNLYVGWELFDENTKNLVATITEADKGKNEPWPGGDHCEIFVDGDQKSKGLYYQFAFDFKGNRYDGLGVDNKWNGKWEITTKVSGDAWRAVLTIPLSTIGVNLSETRTCDILFYRAYPNYLKHKYNGKDVKIENSSWYGGKVHMPSDMHTIYFDSQKQP